MPRLYIFADEAGCFEFSWKQNASRYFILCTVTMESCAVGDALVDLRRQLAWEGAPLGEYFHACEDQQMVRDAVFKAICAHPFRIDAVVLEKSKAQPQVRVSRERFYKIGWYYHFKHVGPQIIRPDHELLTTTASLGTKRERAAFVSAVDDVMRQTVRKNKWAMTCCPAAVDPCLQVADYCAWALQRKWERNDLRSYALIKDRIATEFDLWASGEVHHY